MISISYDVCTLEPANNSLKRTPEEATNLFLVIAGAA
jgi:hypothetical protein